MPQHSTIIGKFIQKSLTIGASALRTAMFHNPTEHNVEVTPNIAYHDSGLSAHSLDVYRPLGNSNVLPALLYIHGGGFNILSKDSHWMMARNFARQGYCVFTINYRLAPEHPYPHALEDCAHALLWILKNAKQFKADAKQLVISGESAGANLTLAMTLLACKKGFPFEWAKEVYKANPAIKAIIPSCGLNEVHNTERFLEEGIASIYYSRVKNVCYQYLAPELQKDKTSDLASPLRILEQDKSLNRPLPPAFILCGDQDPVLNDSKRLHAVYKKHNALSEFKTYRGHHAFHALYWMQNAKKAWQDQFEFLKKFVDI